MEIKFTKLIEELKSDTINRVLLLSTKPILVSSINTFNNIDTTLNPSEEYDLVIIDNMLIHAIDLNALWNSLKYNATIYIDNFHLGNYNSVHGKFNNLLKQKHKEVVTSRQMLVNGAVETFLIVKCFPATKTTQFLKQSSEKPLVVVTVLKSGGIYNSTYVNRLANAINKHLTVPYTFICLSDIGHENFNSNVHQTIKIAHGFQKWWSKIELFRKGIFVGKRVAYFDLDTLIIDNIDFINDYVGQFCGLRDFYHMVNLGSGVMLWDGDDEHLIPIYKDFLGESQSIMNNYIGGDQEWINQKTKHFLKYIQDYFPKKIVSFKKDCFTPSTKTITYPDKAAIVCFHGSPRMHELDNHTQIKPHWFDL